MDDSLLSPESLQRLGNLPAELEQNPTLDDVVACITSAASPDSLLEAALAAYAYLGLYSAQVNDDISKLVASIAARLLPVREAQDNPLIAEAGIACLTLITTTWSRNVDEPTLLQVTAYTDPHDPWTTRDACNTASRLLEEQLAPPKWEEFVVGPVLQTLLKPLFAKSSSRVTASGRPSHYDDPAAAATRSKPASNEPAWKKQCPSAMTTFQWAVKSSNQSLIQHHWPLFTPVLLSLAEDEDLVVRTRGLEILASFIEKCPPQTLHTTGIATIFQDVAFPALLFLPSLTPEEQSVNILTSAYDVLIKLGQAHQEPQSLARRKLLDKVLRDGIYAGYHHASEYARVVTVLMECTTSIVNCLGIYSVKHMQNLLSMITALMTDPFATAHPPAILAASRALDAVITNCWPRLSEMRHAEQIIKAVSLCWINLHDEADVGSQISGNDRQPILEQLLLISKMLRSIWAQPGFSPPARLAEVLKEEPRLMRLFPTSEAHQQPETGAAP